jgi:poly(hydroxyalkanoate) depolymerase family esterase
LLAGTPPGILVSMVATCRLHTFAFRRNLRCVLAAALLTIGALAGADAAEPSEETAFGSNPGNLRMFSYVPADLAPTAPLIVVLHGCKQKAAAFARDADSATLALLLPEQKGLPRYLYDVYLFPWVVAMFGANNQNACFNWFEPDDTVRDRGEALSIRQMIDAMVERHSVDRSRVYVVGLSAGGAMTAVMLAAYPERFAGGAIVAGVPYGCADTVTKALHCMNACFDRSRRACPAGLDLAGRRRHARRPAQPARVGRAMDCRSRHFRDARAQRAQRTHDARVLHRRRRRHAGRERAGRGSRARLPHSHRRHPVLRTGRRFRGRGRGVCRERDRAVLGLDRRQLTSIGRAEARGPESLEAFLPLVGAHAARSDT